MVKRFAVAVPTCLFNPGKYSFPGKTVGTNEFTQRRRGNRQSFTD